MRDSFLFESHPGVSRSSLADVELFNVHWKTVTWVKHSEQSNCYNCDNRFSLLNRYHHCRSCGNCICHKCSLFKPLPCFGYKHTRVCKYCCGYRAIEMYVDQKHISDDNINKSNKIKMISRKRELQYQQKCIEVFTSNKTFVLSDFNVSESDNHMLHSGYIQSRKITLKCYLKWFTSSLNQQFIIDEINTLRMLHHPNISRIIKTNILCDGIVIPQYPYMITGYSEFGTLDNFCLNRYYDKDLLKVKQRSLLDWEFIIKMLIQIVNTLQYLDETHRIMHNDIHMMNILVVRDCLDSSMDSNTATTTNGIANTNKNNTTTVIITNSCNNINDIRSSMITNPNILIKLINFSNSKTSEFSHSCLLPIKTHRAPEIWRKEQFNITSDIFSFGQLIAQILLVTNTSFCSNFPSDDYPLIVLNTAICTGMLPPIDNERSNIGIELAHIIKECWKDSDWRPSFREIEKHLNDIQKKYFNNI